MKVSMTPSEFALKAAALIATSNYPEYEFQWVANRLKASHEGLVHIASRETSCHIQIMSDIWGMEYPTEVLSWCGPNGLRWVRDAVTSTEDSGDGVYALKNVNLLKVTSNGGLNDWTRQQIFQWVDEKAGVPEAEVAAKNAYDTVLAESRRLVVGANVRVARGRKVPVGTTGKLVAVLEGQWGKRAGITTSGRRDPSGRFADMVWTAESNVEMIVDPVAVEAKAVAASKAARDTAKAKIRAMWTETLSKYGVTREIPKVIAEVQDGEEE